MTEPIFDVAYLVHSLAGFVSLVLAAPVCFLLFTKIILYLILGKGVGQLKKTMSWLGLICAPAFVAWVADTIINILNYVTVGSLFLSILRSPETIAFFVCFYGAAFTFVFYLGERWLLRKGRQPRGRYYIIWFLFFLVMCYVPMIAIPFLDGRD